MRWVGKRSVPAGLMVLTLAVTGCGPTCPENQDLCAGACTSITLDRANCGACGVTCADGEICAAGQCEVTCQAPQKNCDGLCKDTRSDSENCGACGNACAVSSYCSAGVCKNSCPAGFTLCGSTCVNLQNDPAHCGGCETACGTGLVCGSGTCSLNCPGGSTKCGSSCTLLMSDVKNCGQCEVTCPVPSNGDPGCVLGLCKLGACTTGFADCNANAGDGCETNTKTDALHCGTCTTSCPARPNAASVCTNGLCGLGACNVGFADCDNNPSNGCEVNLKTDPLHCNTCMSVCTAPAHGAAACNDGNCGLGACDPDYGNCDGIAANGCEINLTNDSLHCGSCPNACSVVNASTLCEGSQCKINMCTGSFRNCDAAYSNGCEVNINSSVAHCSGCNQPCTPQHAIARCQGGNCGFTTCDTDYASCDSIASNGCETDLRSTLAHCGACHQSCSLANATSSCANRSCVISACNPGYGNCDSNPATGCETNTQTSVLHCSVCGQACTVANGVPSCNAGNCAVSSCDMGYADCDASATNGCECFGACTGAGGACVPI